MIFSWRAYVPLRSKVHHSCLDFAPASSCDGPRFFRAVSLTSWERVPWVRLCVQSHHTAAALLHLSEGSLARRAALSRSVAKQSFRNPCRTAWSGPP